MPLKRKKKKKKAIKYKSISFKLSSTQKKSLENYCKARKTTPTKLMKKLLKPFLQNYSEKVPEEYHVSERQLEMFSDNE
ncbi:MAG: hypothetical protein JEY97_15895 [Bacteroidales bacterium]|nr:hypothetical protein [Bacteroidales bacterium]